MTVEVAVKRKSKMLKCVQSYKHLHKSRVDEWLDDIKGVRSPLFSESDLVNTVAAVWSILFNKLSALPVSSVNQDILILALKTRHDTTSEDGNCHQFELNVSLFKIYEFQ